MVSFQTAYGEKVRADWKSDQPSLTKQQFREECDINNILAKYNRQMGRDLMADYSGYFSGVYGDVSAVVDFQTAYKYVDEAVEAFASLPSSLRSRFNNNPEEMLRFVSDENNRSEAEKLGLLKKAEVAVVDAGKSE